MLSPPEARDLLRCVGCGKGLKDTLSLAGHRTGCSDACAGRQETRGRGLPPCGRVLLVSKARVHSASSICGLSSLNRLGVPSLHFFQFALLCFAGVAFFTN